MDHNRLNALFVQYLEQVSEFIRVYYNIHTANQPCRTSSLRGAEYIAELLQPGQNPRRVKESMEY
ncbi:hypothetical protein NEOLI_005439 [Neolecta irregularis DAH-3]|uniref:Uncharacterized protein n=1 Tax=Neolecta irregularis (strain DAH-3) TaxID=1198029 RepID=A0A1U7LGH6_NEOID|nr:hypothetical protein NEOLI_005439 [Neolecta irregularis DAH-3]|eukprot:OLL21749.1 hypothetical protein NEOLI_005439 [Neolecta irregularis DAH-3]